MKKMLSAILAMAMILSLSTCAMAATGLGSVTTVSANAAGEKDGSVSVNTTLCAVSLDAEGKITSITFDIVQSKATFDANGALLSEESATPQSKRELKDSYGMKAASAIGKEWYEQMDALEAWCIGKTVEEVLNMPLFDRGDGRHNAVPDDVDLKSSCTVSIGDQLKSLEKASAAAK